MRLSTPRKMPAPRAAPKSKKPQVSFKPGEKLTFKSRRGSVEGRFLKLTPDNRVVIAIVETHKRRPDKATQSEIDGLIGQNSLLTAEIQRIRWRASNTREGMTVEQQTNESKMLDTINNNLARINTLMNPRPLTLRRTRSFPLASMVPQKGVKGSKNPPLRGSQMHDAILASLIEESHTKSVRRIQKAVSKRGYNPRQVVKSGSWFYSKRDLRKAAATDPKKRKGKLNERARVWKELQRRPAAKRARHKTLVGQKKRENRKAQVLGPKPEAGPDEIARFIRKPDVRYPILKDKLRRVPTVRRSVLP